MHRILVEEKRWLSESRFLHALNYCMLLPGPEAMQLVTYSGWLLNGVRGGLVAGLLFVLPGFLSILILSMLYVGFSGVPWLEALFYGIKPAVVAVVIVALLGMARRSLRGWVAPVLAFTAFVAMFVFAVPFPWVIGFAAGIGILLGLLKGKNATRSGDTAEDDENAHRGEPVTGRQSMLTGPGSIFAFQ